MAIKDLYQESQKEKKNEVKSSDEVKMPFDEFCEEHLCLIKILREGSREELLAEAKEQEEELKEELKNRNMSMDDIEEEEEEEEED